MRLRRVQARDQSGDLTDLFAARPDNTFLIKASYWTNF